VEALPHPQMQPTGRFSADLPGAACDQCVPMSPACDEADIRRRIDMLAKAVRALDLEGVKSIYAPDLVSFDIVPPLQHLGAKAKWRNWEDVFTVYQPPLGYEIRDLAITVGDDVAFGRSLNRISGRLKNGNRSDYGFGGRLAFGRSRATGSSRTIRSRCLSTSRAAERCSTSSPDEEAPRLYPGAARH
jgi:ketosteroid isomerase-like protein